MTTTSVVQTEIARFLQSKEFGGNSNKRKWGVGKTYTWNAGLAEVRAKKSYALGRYSYVSLFGINSLELLKLAIFENLEFLEPPPASAIDKRALACKFRIHSCQEVTTACASFTLCRTGF